jgi:hypothetical protein
VAVVAAAPDRILDPDALVDYAQLPVRGAA